MKKLKTLLLTALSCVALGCVMPKTAVTASADTRDFMCTYTAQAKDSHYVLYGSSAVHTYTAEQAAATGVPAGYENEVLQVMRHSSTKSGCGILLDFSEEQVPVTLLEALQFRVYLGVNAGNTGKYPEVRIPEPGNLSGSWVHQPGMATPVGEWTTVTIAYSESKFAKISKNGMLDKFELGFRYEAEIPVYVDSIGFTLKANEEVAPVITSDETYAVELGEALEVTATAFDARENRYVEVEYTWDDGVALNENGTPTAKGTYNLTLTAKDYYGNIATKIVSVNVVERDRVNPVIDVNYDTVKTMVGTKPMLNITATDDSGSVTVTKTWSDGALDMRGRLTEGTHTWTIKAVDPFGNTTEKVITFIVTENEPQYGSVTNEENRVEKYTITFDGENETLVTHGFTVKQPEDPVKENTVAESYTFLGWYFGEEEWDFSNSVTQDMNLTAKWSVTKQVYNVSFDGENASFQVEYGETIPENKIPEQPQKEMDSKYSYVFAGWYNGEELWNFETSVVTGDVTLVAKFDKVERVFIITFDGENAQEVKYGGKVIAPAEPEREGFVFEGWYSGITKWDFEKYTVSGNMNLTSKWKVGTLPPQDSDSQDSSTETDSETPDGVVDSATDSVSDTAQPGTVGCAGVIGGTAATLTALGLAVVTLLKKKND